MADPLTRDQFREVVRNTPLVSIDLVILDPDGRMLVGLRNNEPAKGVYFVPGGVIRKNERMADAFRRVLETETGLEMEIGDAKLLGAYEHFYDANRFQEEGYGTHYVVLGMRLDLPARPDIRLDDQHKHVRWMTPQEILAADDVHENTKAYFRPAR